MSSPAPARARRAAIAVARRLPPRAQQYLVRARNFAAAPTPARASAPGRPAKAPPKRFRVTPAPPVISDNWPEPPAVEVPGRPVRSVYEEEGAAPAYDIDLFVRLNEEYASKPIVPVSQGKDTASRAERARRRLLSIHS